MAASGNDGVKKKDPFGAASLTTAAFALAGKTEPLKEPDERPESRIKEYTPESWKQQVEQAAAAQKKFEKTGGVAEAHLVDGELKFDDDEEEAKKDRDPNLVEGNLLPVEYSDVFDNKLLGKPLEEIDKYMKDKSLVSPYSMTFIAVAPRFKKKFIYRFTSEKALFLLTPWNPVRKLAVFIATNQFFDYVVILTILTNCVFMSLGPDSKAAETAEYAFLAIYTLESIIKILARGFILHKFTYLRDPWNWLDFAVIVSAYVTTIISEVSGSSGTNLQALRTFRVFRALKTISIVPGLKTLVGALLRAFKLLFEVIILITFCLAVFALFGLQVYMGVLRQKCVVDVPSYNATSSMNYLAYYNDWIKNTSNWYEDPDNGGTYVICGNASGSGQCNSGYTCLPDIGENPNYGYTSFDHFGWAMLTSFQLITLDFWEDSYNKIIRASGPWNVLFFVIVVFFGSFYLINLMLAVVAMSYQEEAVSAGKVWRFGPRSYPLQKHEDEKKEKADNEKKQKEREKQKLKELTSATKAAQKWNPGHRKNKTGILDKTQKDSGSKNDKNDKKSDTTNGEPLIKYGKGRNPMVKMPSKDSGYSVGSKGSSQSNGKDTPRDEGDNDSWDSDSNPRKADSGTGSLSQEPVYEKKTKLKELNGGMTHRRITVVSSSDVQIAKSTGRFSSLSREETVVIIKPDEEGNVAVREKGELVDRNCACCSKTKMFVCWLKFQNILNIFVSDPLFDLFVTICIVLNTLFMMLEHHGQPQSLTTTLEVSNYIFTSVFILEAVLKIMSWSKFYFKSGWNLFDFVIVIASIIDISLSDIPSFSVFRSFRLLRVLKLAQSWKTMRLLLQIILNTLGSLGPLTLILIIVIYIFAVIGLQLFSKSYTTAVFGDDMPRWHFKDFFHSMMMVFRVLCGEWIEPLWDCMRAEGELCMVVFLPTLVLGNFIVLNLFLALLINAFASDNLKANSDKEEDNKMLAAVRRIKELCCCCLSKKVAPNEAAIEEGMELSSDIESINSNDKNGNPKEVGTDKKNPEKLKLPPISQSNGAVQNKDNNNKDAKVKDKDAATGKDMDDAFKTKRDTYSSFNDAKNAAAKKEDKDKSKDDKDDKNKDAKSENEDDLSLGEEASTHSKKDKEEEKKEVVVNDCFPLMCSKKIETRFLSQGWEHFDQTTCGIRWYKFRRVMTMIVESKVFEATVLICIGLSSMSLAFEDIYLYEKPELEQALYIINIIFVVLFTIEMLMKWFALGMKAYFSSFWTILDFLIVVISWASFAAAAAGAADISAFRSLRTLRALRPLRAISRWQGMKIVVNALMLSIPSIINVIIVCLVFWLIFSIMGVQFFAGKFFKCVDNDGEKFDPLVIANKSHCISSGYNWTNSKINFDHVGQGFLSLFQVATFEGWMELMEDAVDATQVDIQPKFESNIWYYLFFVAFIVFGSFFTLNLIISVIIDNFNELKKQYEGHVLDMFLTTTQRNYMNTLKKLGNKKPQKTIKRPKNTMQGVFYDVAVSTKFDLCIVVVIFMNMIVMGIEHYKQSEMVIDILQIMNIIFTTVFTLEAAIKITGLRFHYFRQPWNVFDFIVVVLSILVLILQESVSGFEDALKNISISPTLFRVARVFRIGRILRMIKGAKGIRKLIFALVISLPALVNIGALLALIMFIYSIIGMSSFGNLKIAGGIMDEDVINFKTFSSSFVLMLRISTSAGWNDILEPLLIQPPDCNPDYITRPDGTLYKQDIGDCGQPWLAILFMCSYILITYLVIINTYIAVILENFNQAHAQEEIGITEDDFDAFYIVWEKYDPLATQFIKFDQLSLFVAELDEPLGIPPPNEIALVAFDIPIVQGDKMHCLDILMHLVIHVLGNVEETEEFTQLREELQIKFAETFPTRVKTTKTSSTMTKKKEDVAAKTLQRAWKSFKTQKNLRNITQLAKMMKNQDDAQSNSQKNTGVLGLGRRLTNSLRHFFGASRPTSAISRTSIKNMSLFTDKTKVKTLQVPNVRVLYPNVRAVSQTHL
ncbi:sodium channel protein 1 brain-like isoform X1 [Mytilus trossulus]|uniref:sodium channel protein 1 brain-like isoform X1 n=1 Tax=Mytilus trossulus TaxID=6551 RepID=UPI003003F7B2